MPITPKVMRSDGAGFPSRPSAAAGTNHGAASTAPAERFSKSRRVRLPLAFMIGSSRKNCQGASPFTARPPMLRSRPAVGFFAMRQMVIVAEMLVENKQESARVRSITEAHVGGVAVEMNGQQMAHSFRESRVPKTSLV